MVRSLTQQPPFPLAQNPERQGKIVPAKGLNPADRADLERSTGRDVPTVDPGPPNPAIAARDDMTMEAQGMNNVLDQQQARLPVSQIEPGGHLYVGSVSL